MDLPLAIIFLVKQVREFGLDLLIVGIPRAGPRCSLASLPFHCIAEIGSVFPEAKSCV